MQSSRGASDIALRGGRCRDTLFQALMAFILKMVGGGQVKGRAFQLERTAPGATKGQGVPGGLEGHKGLG